MNLHRFSVPIMAFDGGLNTKGQPTNLPANQSPDMQNVDFDDYGAIGTTPGYAKFNTAAIATAAIDGLHSYCQNDGTQKLIAACNGTVYYASSTAFVPIPGATSVFTGGVAMEFVTTDNRLICVNGYKRPYKWDGTNFTHCGPSAPTGTLSVACSASGVLTGAYKYALTAVNTGNVESDYNVLSATDLTATSGRLTVSEIPIFPTSAGVNTLYLYRNTAAASGVYFRVTAVTNGTTSYVDNNADSALLLDPPDDNGVMPPCKYIVSYRNRLFATGNPSYPMRLYWTEPGEPETWPEVNYLDVDAGDGLPISGIRVYENGLVIHKNNTSGQGYIYSLLQPDSVGVSSATNWYLNRTKSAWGGAAHRAQAEFGNLLGFLNRYGWFAFQGENIATSVSDSTVGRFEVDSHSFNIEPDIFDIRNSLIAKSAAITYENKVWLAIPKGSSATENNKIYFYDFVRASSQSRQIGAWGVLSGPGVSCFSMHNGSLYAGSATANGYVYTIDSGITADGAAIDAYYKTPELSGLPEHRNHSKVWRYLFLTVECSGNWDLKLSYIKDAVEEAGTTVDVNLYGGGNLWGTMSWGTDAWGGGNNRKRVRVVLRNCVGKTVQFKFANSTLNQTFKIHEIEVAYNLRSQR